MTNDDARIAKAEAKAAKARSKALKPFYKRGWFIALVVIGVLVIAAAAGGGTKKNDSAKKSNTRSVQASGSNPASSDVAVKTCKNDPTLNSGTATISVTNHSSKASDYLMTVTAVSADGKTQIDSGNATVQSLEPGQATETQAALFTKPFPAGTVCKVSDVTRTAASAQ